MLFRSEHAAKVGAYMEAKLAKLPHVTEVRGRGLMLGCDLDDAAGDLITLNQLEETISIVKQ